MLNSLLVGFPTPPLGSSAPLPKPYTLCIPHIGHLLWVAMLPSLNPTLCSPHSAPQSSNHFLTAFKPQVYSILTDTILLSGSRHRPIETVSERNKEKIFPTFW